jgi:hypothetical protein
MKHLKKINEFINDSEIYLLIESAENSPSSDPEHIANRESYRRVFELGEKVIPYLLERESYIWNIGLKKLTGIEPIGERSSEIVEFWNKWGLENGYKKCGILVV